MIVLPVNECKWSFKEGDVAVLSTPRPGSGMISDIGAFLLLSFISYNFAHVAKQLGARGTIPWQQKMMRKLRYPGV